MVNQKTVLLQDAVAAVATLKTLVAASQDGAVVGVDSVSGDDYFQSMPCIGTIYIGKDKAHRMVVDVLAYPKHRTGNTTYKDENRMISVAFNPDTLEIIPGSRRNNGFDSMASCTVLSIDPFTWVDKQLAVIADKKAKAAAAVKALDLKKVAYARQSAMHKFL